MAGVNVAGFTHWISGGGKVEPQASDKDVFGDGTVKEIHYGAGEQVLEGAELITLE